MMAKTAAPIKAVVTYLEQTTRPKLYVPMPVNLHVALMKQSEMPLHFYRYLQYRTGQDYHWVARLRLNDDALQKIVHDPATSIHVLYLNGAPAGFYELHNKDPETVGLEYFGLMSHAQGLGLGRWFLAQAIETAWGYNPLKVKVSTCTLDHSAALPLYQKLGFAPIGQSETFIHPLSDADIIRMNRAD
jgi:thiosulfate/3-mercaptopyruvate sulfurtransferase